MAEKGALPPNVNAILIGIGAAFAIIFAIAVGMTSNPHFQTAPKPAPVDEAAMAGENAEDGTATEAETDH